MLLIILLIFIEECLSRKAFNLRFGKSIFLLLFRRNFKKKIFITVLSISLSHLSNGSWSFWKNIFLRCDSSNLPLCQWSYLVGFRFLYSSWKNIFLRCDSLNSPLYLWLFKVHFGFLNSNDSSWIYPLSLNCFISFLILLWNLIIQVLLTYIFWQYFFRLNLLVENFLLWNLFFLFFNFKKRIVWWLSFKIIIVFWDISLRFLLLFWLV